MNQNWFWRAQDFPDRLDYYKTSEIYLPSDWKFRMFFFMVNKKGIKCRVHSVENPKEYLRELFIRYLPDQCYYRTSLFLNPEKVKKRSASDHFLGSDLVFDIDGKDLQEARDEALKLLDYLKENNYPEPSIRFSGQKGYHILCEGFFKGQTEKEVLQKSKEILNDVLAKGIKVDWQVTADSRRIIGLPGTLHGATGNRRRLITLTELSQVALGTVEKPNDSEEVTKVTKAPPRTLQRKRADSKAMPLPELGSSILNTRGRHIYIRKFLHYSSKEIENAAKDLPHHYIFQAGESIYYLVCLKAFNLEELRYPKKQQFLPMCQFVSFKEKGPCIASMGHVTAFRALGLPVPQQVEEYCGGKKTKVFRPVKV